MKVVFIIVVVIVVICIIAYKVQQNKEQEEESNQNDGGQDPRGLQLYQQLTGWQYDPTLDPYPQIPLVDELIPTANKSFYYNESNIQFSLEDVLLKYLYPDIYYCFLKNQLLTDDRKSMMLLNKLSILISGTSLQMRHSELLMAMEGLEDSTESFNTFILPEIRNVVDQFCPLTYKFRMNAIDPKYAYQYSAGNVTPKSVIEELELNIFLSNNQSEIKQAEKNIYENDDMRRIKQLVESIPPKIKAIDSFNNQLQGVINEYEEKAIKTIEVSYGSVLQNVNISREMYFRSFNTISANFASKINAVVATACDTSVKKVAGLINQKQDLINKNNVDRDKYVQLINKLKKQYDDEFALQKIKEINQDVNSQMDDTSDLAQKEEGNINIQSIIGDIDQLDQEVNERRNYEIEHGQIEI